MTAPIPKIVTADQPTFNMMVYGRPGAGKTYFTCTAQDCPPMRNVLLISVEGGELTVAHRGDILSVKIQSIEELDEIFWALENNKNASSPYHGIKTVILDNVTELQTLDLENIVKKEVDAKTNPKRVNYDDIWRDDYGKSTTRMKRALRWFRNAQINFIVTAWPKEIYGNSPTEQGPPVEIKPSLTTKLADTIMGYQDFVWYLYADNEGQRFLVTSDAQNPQKTWYRAKTRGQRFADTIGKRVALGHTGEAPQLPELYYDFIKAEGGKSLAAEKNDGAPKVAAQQLKESKPVAAKD